MLRFSRAAGQLGPIVLADRARDAHQWEAAVQHYRTALTRNPRNPPIWVQYGHVLKEAGRHAAAEAAYRRAIAGDPAAADPYLHLGHVLRLQGRTEEAKAAYLRALSIDRSLQQAAGELAALGCSTEDLPALLRGVPTAVAADQTNGLARRKRRKESIITRADRARDLGQWEIAARLYRRALDRNPSNPSIWIQYGHALKECGQRDAEQAYRGAIAYDERLTEAHLQLGRVLKLRGETEAAEQAFLRAFALDPSLPDPLPELRRLGWSAHQRAELTGFVSPDLPTPWQALTSGESEPPGEICSPATPWQPQEARLVQYRLDKNTRLNADDDVLFYLAWCPDGLLSPLQVRSIEAYDAEGYRVALIVNSGAYDRMVDPGQAPAIIQIVRENIGFDFGGWTHATRLIGGLESAHSVTFTNDSIVGPLRRDGDLRLRARIEGIDADAVFMTENRAYQKHLQSYFFTLKAQALAKGGLSVIRDAPYFDDLDAVIWNEELPLSSRLEALGVSTAAAFPCLEADLQVKDPTVHYWRRLVDTGFPFFKVKLITTGLEPIDSPEIAEFLGAEWLDSLKIHLLLRGASDTYPLLDAAPMQAEIGGLRYGVALLQHEAEGCTSATTVMQAELKSLRDELAAARQISRSLLAALRTGPAVAPASDQLLGQPPGISDLIRHWTGHARR